MCCQTPGTLGLPAAVIEMLARYRRLLQERGWDWGDDRIDFFRWARFSLLGPVFDAFAATGDWAKAVRSVIGPDPPAGIVVVQVGQDGGLRADVGPARIAIAGHTVPIDVVVDSAADADLSLTVAGRQVRVAPGGAAVATIDLDGADPELAVELGDQTLGVQGAIRTAAAPSCGCGLLAARAGRSPTPTAGPGSRRGCCRNGTSITGRSSTATT